MANKLDTAAMFQRLVNSGDSHMPREKEKVDSPKAANEGKKRPMTIYLTDKIAKELRIQSAEKIKAKDQSALTSLALEILLSIDGNTYERLVARAQMDGSDLCATINDALESYLK